MEAKVQDAVSAHAEIARLATANAKPEIRRIEKISVGKVVRQGDIYIHCVEASHASGRLTRNRQLAIGNTQGSRHVVDIDEGDSVLVYEGTALPAWCGPRTFLGPLLESDERFVITHPEHAHVSLPKGRYQVTHQVDIRTMDRVRD